MYWSDAYKYESCGPSCWCRHSLLFFFTLGRCLPSGLGGNAVPNSTLVYRIRRFVRLSNTECEWQSEKGCVLEKDSKQHFYRRNNLYASLIIHTATTTNRTIGSRCYSNVWVLYSLAIHIPFRPGLMSNALYFLHPVKIIFLYFSKRPVYFSLIKREIERIER